MHSAVAKSSITCRRVPQPQPPRATPPPPLEVITSQQCAWKHNLNTVSQLQDKTTTAAYLRIDTVKLNCFFNNPEYLISNQTSPGRQKRASSSNMFVFVYKTIPFI